MLEGRFARLRIPTLQSPETRSIQPNQPQKNMPTVRLKPRRRKLYAASPRRHGSKYMDRIWHPAKRALIWTNRHRDIRFQREPRHRTQALGAIVGILWVAMLLVGCSSTRPLGDVALGAGGAVLGNQLSDGSPVATAAGAVGGVLLSEGLHYLANKQNQKAYVAGYDKGKSDAVKQQYWLQVAQQREQTSSRSVRLYPIQLPEQRIDGVIFQPATKYLRIEE